jgi:hypothetical protein
MQVQGPHSAWRLEDPQLDLVEAGDLMEANQARDRVVIARSGRRIDAPDQRDEMDVPQFRRGSAI